ncbi:MAG: hypothetical protein COT74_04085 [Bdellovibrionales bacterium CG10_big_fil_rev_8_21_14_0_10_45_34]|nr:MAG: hypothetical protein COT74_04085 [Bdellovibrionales bacterium CG10_big_fil_rev_8_21_14_0_10_45_34]
MKIPSPTNKFSSLVRLVQLAVRARLFAIAPFATTSLSFTQITISRSKVTLTNAASLKVTPTTGTKVLGVWLLSFMFSFNSWASALECQLISDPNICSSLKEEFSTTEPETRVGNVFMIGVSQKAFNLETKKLIEEIRPGQIIFFGRNISSPERAFIYTRKIQEVFRSRGWPRPIFAIDQEGGSVVRLRMKPHLPSAAQMASTLSTKEIAELAEQVGLYMRNYGFQINLAPVLDIGTPDKSGFLKTRAFGVDPEVVSEVGISWTAGMWSSGVFSYAKHFPGHGSVEGDSHRKELVSNRSKDDLQIKDLSPFKSIFRSTIPSGVMVAHIAYPSIDESGLAAGYSKNILQNLLRQDLGFKGIVITDDLLMGGASKYKTIEERVENSLLAGVSVAMVAWSPKEQLRAFKHVLKLYNSNNKPAWKTLVDTEAFRLYQLKFLLQRNLIGTKKFDFKTYKELVYKTATQRQVAGREKNGPVDLSD